MTFHVGQKVVCVDDQWRDPDWIVATPNKPVRQRVYTVRGVWLTKTRGHGIVLSEIRNPSQYWGDYFGEPGFLACRFRPLTETKTDISIFTSLLDPSNHKPLPEQQPERRKVSHDLCGNE